MTASPGSIISPPAAPAPAADGRALWLKAAAVRSLLRYDGEFRRLRRANGFALEGPFPADHLVLTPWEEVTPEGVFDRLRWGGRFLYVAEQALEAAQVAQQFHGRKEFVVERGPATHRDRPLGLPLPWVGRRFHYVIARKVGLLPPGRITDRFTFDVRLVPRRDLAAGYVVQKQTPTATSIAERLRQRNPGANMATIGERATRLVDRILPIFLTREAAFLDQLQEQLPRAYRRRVPRVLRVERGPDGLVRRLFLNWLRLEGPALSQLEFARQSTDLLRVLHDQVGLIHLDLRLDNFVITADGVGFVDFGSAVRVDEDFRSNPSLGALFDELLANSQIQRTLGRMTSSGLVTSSVLRAGHHKIDKAADLFYLALQIRQPHNNPDFRGLVRFDPHSDEAKRIALLTDAVLRPKDPGRPRYICARDVLNGLRRIESRMARVRRDGQPDPFS